MAITTGKDGFVYIGYSDSGTSFTDEDVTVLAGRTVAYIADRDKRVWHPDTDITITYTGGTYSGTATVYRAGGFITFSPALGAGILVSVSGKYIPVASVGLCKSFSLDLTWNTEDATVIPAATDTDGGWTRNAATAKSLSGSVELLMSDTASHEWRDAILGNPDESIDGGSVLYVEVGITSDWTMGAIVWPSTSMSASASALNTETVNFVMGDDPPYFYDPSL